MSNRIAAAVITGIAVAVLILAILAACTPPGACAATQNPGKPATVKPAPRPTVTVTKHSTYKLDVDHDDDHC